MPPIASGGALWTDLQWLSYVEASAELGAPASKENKLVIPAGFFRRQALPTKVDSTG